MKKTPHCADDDQIPVVLERGGFYSPSPVRPEKPPQQHLSELEECFACHQLFVIQQVIFCDGGQIVCFACSKP